VVVAVLFNLVRMGLAAFGYITPLFSIVFMIVSIFAILLNTLRIRGIDLGREEVEDAGPLAELELLIPNMVCEGCAEKISTALTALPGVREVKPKVTQKYIYIRYQPAHVQEQQLKEAVAEAGFIAVET